jgi:hypothetical protein
MARLTRADMEAALAFAAEVGTAAALAHTGRSLAAASSSARPH